LRRSAEPFNALHVFEALSTSLNTSQKGLPSERYLGFAMPQPSRREGRLYAGLGLQHSINRRRSLDPTEINHDWRDLNVWVLLPERSSFVFEKFLPGL